MKRFDEDPDLAAIRVRRGVLARVRMPGPLAALPLGPGAGAVLARKAFRVPWTAGPLPAADGFAVRVRLEWVLHWNEEAPAAIARALSDGASELRSKDLLELVRPQLEQAVRSWLAREPAARLAAAAPEELVRSLRARLPAASGSAVACPAVERIAVESTEYDEHARAAAGEAVREAAARLAARGLENRWRALEAAPAPRAAARPCEPEAEPAALVALGGRIVLLAGTVPVREVDVLEGGMGPLRSIATLPDGSILAGARDGVLVFGAGLDTPPGRFPLARAGEEGRGVNAVLVRDGDLFATHGERGLVVWRRDESGAPGRVLDPAPDSRGLLQDPAGRLIYGAGTRIRVLEPGQTRPRTLAEADGEVTALARWPGRLLAGTRCGRVVSWDDAGLARTLLCGANPILGLAAAGWDGGRVVLVGSAERSVRGIDEDGVLRRLHSADRPVGILAAGAGGVLALSTDRRVLYRWRDGESPVSSWTPGRPISAVVLADAEAKKTIAWPTDRLVRSTQVVGNDRLSHPRWKGRGQPAWPKP